jgi:hypothetical protein
VTCLVRVDELEPGDEIRMPKCEPVVVEEVLAQDDGRIVVRWWRPTDPGQTKRRRYLWTHPRQPDGEPRRTRYSMAALRAINEAIDGRELGSLVPLEPGTLVHLIARERRPS